MCAMVFAVSAWAQDATLTKAKSLLDSKQPQAAFELLDPLESSRAGDPEFDYLLGIAAVDSGKYTRGVFALERVIAVNPNHPQARAEIARAYFLMGENRAAKEEFEAVRASNPPAGVMTTVNQFLDALQARESARNTTGISGYLEMAAGYDSNANAATGIGSFALPAFSGIQVNLSSTGQRTETWYRSLTGGVSGRYRLSADWALVGSALLSQRWNGGNADQFDIGTLAADGGASWRSGDHEVTGLLQTQESRVDYNTFRRANGGTLQYRYSLTPESQATFYGQRSRLVYPGQRQRDAYREVLGAAYARGFAGKLAPLVYAGAYGGQERTNDPAFGHFGHRVNGFRVGGQVTLDPKVVAFVNASYEDRLYHNDDPLFLVKRHDRQSDIRTGVNWSAYRNWTITPSVAWTDNRSNIVVNDYARWIVSITARVDFR
jgi:tetratricopeptide (TPR) repeat protein